MKKMQSEASPLRPAILIISETAFKDPATDKAGNILCETLQAEGSDKWAEPWIEIVPDDTTRIQNAVRKWTDDDHNSANMIITTGGTGFAVKDITPEVRHPSNKTLRALGVTAYGTANLLHRPLHRSSTVRLLA